MGAASQQAGHSSNLLGAAKPVHGAWGSGTLLTTSLFSMLMTNGEVYIGAVPAERPPTRPWVTPSS